MYTASGIPKPVCSSHTATNCPLIPRPRGPSRSSIGWNATWIGTTITATMRMNRISRPGNRMKANAYAAKAANMIGSTVAGTATITEFSSEDPAVVDSKSRS